MNKKIWWTIGILLVVATTLLILKKKEIIGKKEAIKVATEKIIRRTIIETVSASGKVYPEDERKVSSDVSGEVVEMYVEEGDSVRKGQLLAKVFADVLTSAKDRAASVVNQQQAQVGNTEASLRAFEARLNQAKLSYGHGAIDAQSEALWIISKQLQISPSDALEQLQARLDHRLYDAALAVAGVDQGALAGAGKAWRA